MQPGIGVLPAMASERGFIAKCANCAFEVRCYGAEGDPGVLTEEQHAALISELSKPDASTVLRMHALQRRCSKPELQFSDAATGAQITELRTTELVGSQERLNEIVELARQSGQPFIAVPYRTG